MSVGVSKLSNYTNLIFVDPAVKVDGAYYHDVLLSQQLLPAIMSGLWRVLHLSARRCPSALARETINLERELNPVELNINLVIKLNISLDIMLQRVYQTKMQYVDNLRQCMIDVRAGMQQSVIDDATDQWRMRLHNCMRGRGGHFEYSL